MSDDHLDVLVLCTANICRSPMASAILSDLVARRGLPVTVSSAGFLTQDEPASANAVRVLADEGIDLSAHRSRILGAEDLEGADLVVAMEYRHVREVAVLLPAALERSFTLPDLARRATEIGPRRPGELASSWIARAGAGRRAADLMVKRPEGEVSDPYGRSKRAYRKTRAELEGLIQSIVSHLYP